MGECLGLYLHIPFCRSKCDYCDFYSLAGREDRMDDYQKALLCHVVESGVVARNYPVDSLYIGGGTPTWYGEKRLLELLRTVKRHFSMTKDVEVTLEANPDSVDEKMLRRLRRAGVNRISMGMQSGSDEELRSIHRPHTYQQVVDAVTAVRSAKIRNLNLDLIYGLPGQTEESWHETVEKAISLSPEHLSCYGLTVEEGTPLAQRVARGEQLPDEDQQAALYLWTVERLAQAGYQQYEISNFSKQGYMSRHNLKYWMGRPYMGLGAAAHSDFGGRRFSFVSDLETYIQGMLSGDEVVDESEQITRRERGSEYLMLRLRTVHGIDEWEYRREYMMNFDPIEAKMCEFEQKGWARRRGRRWQFTPEGFLLSNQLIGQLLELQENATLGGTLERIRKQREEN
ncbi:radical SAM family heme chaperone HemW [Pseudoflavonifractor capillosus]|uniref:radical SAM family heme chaperone HemW n=1 Tax=Pseudoflavonifractor capillosus TaxID=106588 RepID=UPI0019591DAF|nr:radical SAM family heme chaperone HemW [Pseudoflavonifractor capillosus]MBM6896634.1 radical SAM family heme chaperone HemW [Pseudoflavonifractor capillosus]